MKTKVLARIEQEEVVLYLLGPGGEEKDEVVQFLGACRIDNDGIGPAEGDPHHQNQTSLMNNGTYLNAQEELFIAIPPQICQKTKGKVLGCLCFVENLSNEQSCLGVVGDIGPKNKVGEVSSLMARVLGVDSDPVSGGDNEHDYEYTIYVGNAAYVNGIKYELQSFGGGS
jgi:hypothetical protein